MSYTVYRVDWLKTGTFDVFNSQVLVLDSDLPIEPLRDALKEEYSCDINIKRIEI